MKRCCLNRGHWTGNDDAIHRILIGSRGKLTRVRPPLLIYCYANGVFSSRRIECATHRDLGVRFVAANNHTSHDTIATFWHENLAAVAESFLQVLLLARELKLVKVGMVSVDGSQFGANASKHRSVRYDRAGELIEQLRLEIAALMERAEAADAGASEDPQALPREIVHRQALCARLDAARRRLEVQARARAEAECAAYEAKVAVRARRKGRAKGKRAKPPEGTPRGDEQSNLNDLDSRLMRKSKRHEYRHAYNAQAVVDAEGSQLILGARISQCIDTACRCRKSTFQLSDRPSPILAVSSNLVRAADRRNPNHQHQNPTPKSDRLIERPDRVERPDRAGCWRRNPLSVIIAPLDGAAGRGA